MLIGCYKTMYIYIFSFSIILNYIFIKLTNNKLIFNLEFFLINNNCINARFLSRYISRKLKQNYAIKELLNPIKKDLLYVLKLSIVPKKSYIQNLNKRNLINYNNKNTNKLLYKNIIIFLCNNFRLQLYKFFIISNVLINTENFLINFKINKKITNIFERKKLIYNYFQKNIFYKYFFENNYKIYLKVDLFLPKLMKNIKFKELNKFYHINYILLKSIYLDKFILTNINMSMININLKNLRQSCINFNKFMKFEYWTYQINLETKHNNWKLNNLKARNYEYTKANNLIGYKMYLSGRFKRKQRAAYYWFSKGKVPLNTLKAHIDYSYYTIALKNSAITVKIWLYKSTNLNNLYYIKIY